MKHNSKYEAKYARRKRGGKIRIELPVDKDGNATLNPQQIAYRYDRAAGAMIPAMRSFERIRRADEVGLD